MLGQFGMALHLKWSTEAAMDVFDKPLMPFLKAGAFVDQERAERVCSKLTPVFGHCSYQVGIIYAFLAVLCTSKVPLTLPLL